MSLKAAIIIPDCHIPHEDKRAYAIMLKIAKDVKPQGIYILGDFADYFCISAHSKDPTVSKVLIDELDAVNARLDELDKLFPRAKKCFIQGNHEFRWERFLQDKAPELIGMVDNETMFKLRNRPGWQFIPYGPTQKVSVLGSKLYARHEPLGNSAKATAARALCSIVHGHIHSIEENHIVGLDDKNHVAFSVGWLGDKRKNKVFGYVKNNHQWQLGFGVVYVDEKTKYFYHKKIHILDNYTCEFNGKVYRYD